MRFNHVKVAKTGNHLNDCLQSPGRAVQRRPA